jgi:DNA repair protein RadA/Sms
MALSRTLYACQSCGYQSTKWLGRCPECGAWTSFVEELRESAGAGKAPGSRRRRAAGGGGVALVPLSEVETESVARTPSGLAALDRVLGGGVVAGGAVLLAGEPGIGKSTLLLQLAERLARDGGAVVYASAEESPRQLRLRAERLGCASSGVMVAGETRLDALIEAWEANASAALLVDSIQAVRADELESPPGSIGQVRHCANVLVERAKRSGAALFLVGHVTKEGTIAGPKSLEHLVDTVLSFEGERESEYRILRATKNRFGPTGEIAMFEMREAGLEPIADPSGVLLARRRGGAPGSAVLPTMSGSRPLLVEAQALAVPTTFPSPRRMSVGLDPNRVILLVAVLERFARLPLVDRDVFLNVVGGLALREPAADLAVAAALISAARGVVLPERAAYFGELGLLGEVRPVGQAEARLREAAAHGFTAVYMPRTEGLQTRSELKRVEVATVDELAARIGGD